MRDNDGVSTPPLVPRSSLGGIIGVWVAAAIAGIAVGLFAPLGWRAAWLTIVLGAVIIASFAVQLAVGRPDGFLRRVAMSTVGSLFVLGIIAIAFGLAAMVPV
jgi:hypothetical protein